MKKEEIHLSGLSIETAFVYDFTSHGENYPIEFVNTTSEQKAVMMYTKPVIAFGEMLGEDTTIVCIDRNRCVIGVYAKSDSISSFAQAEIVLVFQHYDCDEIASKFKQGDEIRFKLALNYVEVSEVKAYVNRCMDDTAIVLTMDSKEYATVTTNEYVIRGTIKNQSSTKNYELLITYGDGIQSRKLQISILANQSEFEVKVPLALGANYIDCSLLEDHQELADTKSTHIVFQKEEIQSPKQLIMWAEQYVNANVTNSVDKIKLLVDTAKNAGITAFALDVKGVEGYASYKKATRTKVPYMTASINPKKQITMEIDFLEEFIRIAHEAKLKVYTSFNFFVEGNLASRDFAIDLPHTHADWAEVLSAPEDGGIPTSILKTKRNCMLCYVNPSNEEVQAFELERVKEVLDHYEVDGVIMDRTRYDNQYADFSEVTKAQFSEYLSQQGKKLTNWPQDVYSFDAEQSMIFGPLYFDFLTYRSSVIQQFAKKLRDVINEYKQVQNRDILLAAYVGSWYDLYYQNGVNWASENFIYNERLNFPVSKLYTKEYAKTSYLESIDFIMIGCYYETADLIEKYTTIGNLVTNHEVPVIASLSLPHLTTQEALEVGAKACLNLSEGVMIFDLCYTDWEQLTKALQ